MTTRFTTSQFIAANAEIGITKEAAYGFLVFLRKTGALDEDGYEKRVDKKGKGELFYKGDVEHIQSLLKRICFP